MYKGDCTHGSVGGKPTASATRRKYAFLCVSVCGFVVGTAGAWLPVLPLERFVESGSGAAVVGEVEGPDAATFRLDSPTDPDALSSESNSLGVWNMTCGAFP